MEDDKDEDKRKQDIVSMEQINKMQKEEILCLKEELRNLSLLLKNDKTGGNDDPEESCSKVFANHVILSNIFKHLDSSGLKTVRLVCSSWSNLVLSVYTFRLECGKMFPCCTIAPLPPLCPTLAKAIYVHNHCYGHPEHDSEERGEAAANNFLAFCSHFHDSVEDIYLQVDMSFSTPFVEALTSMEFPKLEKIRVLLDDDNPNWTFRTELTQFPIRSQLRKLEVETMSPTPTWENYPFPEIFQKLIESAPNLEELSISDNFYPELSSCAKLRLLELSPTPYESTGSDFNYDEDSPNEEETFSMVKTSRMLEQVKSCIKKVVLSSQSPHIHEDGHVHSQSGQFRLPDVFHKLEVLENYAMELFPLGEWMNVARFPSLKRLVLREQQGPGGVEGLLRGLCERNLQFKTVKSLDFGGIIHPALSLPRDVFPNTTEVYIQLPRHIVGDGGYDVRDKQELFTELFQTVSRWPLKTFGVQIEFRYVWSELVEGLRHLKPVGNGLECLKIKNTDSYGVQDDFDLRWENDKKYVGKFEEILAQSKGMQKMVFQTFSIKVATATRILRFITDNNLPVHFPE